MHQRPPAGRRLAASLLTGFALVLVALVGQPAAAQPPVTPLSKARVAAAQPSNAQLVSAQPSRTTVQQARAAVARQSIPALGDQVAVFDPSMPQAFIQAVLDAAYAAQVDNEMGSDRYAFLFKPGTYGSAAAPLQLKVGYYTEIAGLGASPDDVTIHGKVEVYNRCLTPDNCIALNNFWRTLANLKLEIDGGGQDGCRTTANFWAVSQAVSMRRLDVSGGTLSLMDYCTAGPQYASGGFIADSKLPAVINGSQQQWLIRNSEVASWSNGVWNQVFSGVVGAPTEAGWPDPPYTTLDKTPISREKPYLFVDAHGRWNVRVPSAHRNTSGVSWASGLTAGRTLRLSKFYIAKPGVSVRTINKQLARGKHLLFTPGVYDIGASIKVKRKNTVVLGLGHPTLTAVHGAVPLKVANVAGVVVAGLTIDAGPTLSPRLLEVGAHANAKPAKGSGSNPTTLSDVYFRVGGPHIGKTREALRINADRVLVDHTWVWRADHGLEDFTAGESGDTDRWNTNLGRWGVVVDGDDVTATGLFVEHFQRHNVLWRGERGTTVFFQNELPYDPPTQAAWDLGSNEAGWAAYKVSNAVHHHRLYGGGSYVFNRNNPDIHTSNGFEVPKRPDVKLHHIMTVNLSAGTIDHVVDGIGDAATTSGIGVPVYLADFSG